MRLERETGFEPATPTLARLCSTPELFPPSSGVESYRPARVESNRERRRRLERAAHQLAAPRPAVAFQAHHVEAHRAIADLAHGEVERAAPRQAALLAGADEADRRP